MGKVTGPECIWHGGNAFFCREKKWGQTVTAVCLRNLKATARQKKGQRSSESSKHIEWHSTAQLEITIPTVINGWFVPRHHSKHTNKLHALKIISWYAAHPIQCVYYDKHHPQLKWVGKDKESTAWHVTWPSPKGHHSLSPRMQTFICPFFQFKTVVSHLFRGIYN